MMNIYILKVGYIETNCYIIDIGNENCFIIDPGGSEEEIISFLDKNNLKSGYVLLTHGHFDHCLAAHRLQELGYKIIMSRLDYDLINTEDNLSNKFGLTLNAFVPDIFVVDEGVLTLNDIFIEILFTPGHTKGSVSYIIKDNLFSGDTLFFESIGRIDFPTGNYDDILISLKKIFSLDGNLMVYPGHGNVTTLDHERKYNPYK